MLRFKSPFPAAFYAIFATPLLAQSNTSGSPTPLPGSKVDGSAQSRILGKYGQLPLSFEANYGQTDEQVNLRRRR